MRQQMRDADYDSGIRYHHPDMQMRDRRPTTAPGAHLLPYLNEKERGKIYFP
jgi:hypothetical protein